jgi:hypothetical protein
VPVPLERGWEIRLDPALLRSTQIRPQVIEIANT